LGLYQNYRPLTFEEIVGNTEAVETLQAQLLKPAKDRPHTYLFQGQTGGGKTTLARIMANEVGGDRLTIREINCADARGIDAARDINATLEFIPAGGKPLCLIVDECHQGTKDFWNALLKSLEDAPPHVYFFLCTTDPQKLLKTVTNRCIEITLESLTVTQLYRLIAKVAKKENAEIPKSVLDKISECSDGSARNALTSLESVIGMAGEEQMLATVTKGDADQRQVIDLCRALMNSRAGAVEAILKDIKSQEPESVRRAVLGYCSTILSRGFNGSNAPKAAVIMECFLDNFYDSGYAGLVLSCYQAAEA